MSRPRHRWWGYAKNCVRDYPALRAAAEHARKPENRLRPEDRRELRAVEAAAAEKELPDVPSTDGTYGLQLVMDTGEGTLTWEAAEEETTPGT